MTPQEQIAYLRQNVHQHWNDGEMLTTILAVCDLAERALLTDDEAEAVRRWLSIPYPSSPGPVVNAVLRRLLPDERVEHRLTAFTKFTDNRGEFRCSCGWAMTDAPDAAVRAWAAHAGIGHD